MRRFGSVVGGVALLCLTVAVGWWLRGGGTSVLAQRSAYSSSSSARGGDSLAFQVTGAGPEASLTVYNPDNHTLYIYPRIGSGNSYISCAFSFKVASPGAPIQRENCPIGDQVPPR
jgi:hypothetical protein